MSLPMEMRVPCETVMAREDERHSSPDRYSEEELVRAVQRGDVQGFEELVRRYRNDVFRLALYFLGNREDAWDTSQEVFVKAFRGAKTFRGSSSVKSWLMRITANHCKDIFKKRKLKTVSLDAMPIDQESTRQVEIPDRALEASELGSAIEQAVAELSPKHRMAFILREYEGLSYEEMAEVMNCRPGTVMSRLHHARKKLQETLIGMGVMEGRTI